MARLRGHHLICLHFYHGEGYDAGFVDNLGSVIAKARAEGIQICAGPDDVCRRCPHLKGDACRYNEGTGEAIAEMDGTALRLLGMTAGASADWERIRKDLAPLFREWHSTYCALCTWRRACEKDALFRGLSENAKGHHVRQRKKIR
jgi:hypothetical protein